MLIGGVLPLFFHARYAQLVVASVIFGLGYGGISPLTTALIHEHFPKEEQPMMLGLQSAVIGIGGVLFSFLGGKLAAIQWWYAYYPYFLFVPVILLVLMLPRGSVQDKGQGGGVKGLLNGNMLFYLCQGILFGVFFFTFQTNIALLIAHRGLGGADVAGRVLSVQSAFGIISGILGGRILNKLRAMSLPVIFLTAAAGLTVIFLSGSMFPVYAAAAVLGFVFSLRRPAGYLKATQSVPPACATLAITAYCSASQVGQFLSPLCVNGLSGLMGLSLQQKFALSAMVLAAVGVVSIRRERRRATRH